MAKRLLLLGIALVILVVLLRYAGSMLVRDAPKPADVIVVLGGGEDDSRYWHAVELMKAGFGNLIILDVLASRVKYGRPEVELATDFVARTLPNRARVCPVMVDSTLGETRFVAQCLEPLHVHSVLLVTSDFHTRRSFSIFTKTLPTYQWSIAAARQPGQFGTKWWTDREWAQTFLQEWERLIWWNLVDRWREAA
jgi:uncharacterized SAM-binding protein YcdF (DUF218 family)